MAAYASVTSQFEIETRLLGGTRAHAHAHDSKRIRIAIRSSTVSAQSPVGLLTRRSELPLDVSVYSRLWGVTEQISAGVPARDSDRLIKWFIGVVVIGVGVNTTKQFRCVADGLASAGCLVAALLVAVPSTGSAAGALWHNAGSGLGFARADGYLAVTVWGSVTG